MLLSDEEVHIWKFSLRLDPRRRDHFLSLLNQEERTRAGRFRFHQDQNRFVIARGSLRSILTKYLKQPPETICFRYSPNGKPELNAKELKTPFQFNLSHSHEMGLLAVTQKRSVGVDVERIAPQSIDSIGIAEQFFTSVEADLIRSAPAKLRNDCFFRVWTRKEAFLKACGDGLSGSLSQFEVSLDNPEILFLKHDAFARGSWSVHEYRPCSGYVAAIAIESHVRKFKFLALD